MEQETDTIEYRVVRNIEEQYSIWPIDRELPGGWIEVGKNGLKADCLKYINEVWTDMRPLSVRKRMEELAKNPPPAREKIRTVSLEEDLPTRLSKGEHELEACTFPSKNIDDFLKCIERRYVRVKFTKTHGGTELGFRLDLDRSDVAAATTKERIGTVRLVGDLVLDYVNVTAICNIDLNTLMGKGHLIKRT